MLKRFEYPILYVNDVPRAVAFYVEVVGCVVEDDGGDFVELRLGDSRLALNAANGADKKAGSQTLLASSDNIAEDFEKIRKSAEITMPVTETDYGRTFFFSDPDGNKVEVVE